MEEVSQQPLPNRSALILYGSETGNAQDVAEELGRLAERLRFSTQVAELDTTTLKQCLSHTVVLFAISTTGQGELPANAQVFWKRIRNSRLPPNCLQNLGFASFGLGDSSYPQFNWAHRKLYKRLVSLGAQDVCQRHELAALSLEERGESDEQHPEGTDGTFLPWSLRLRESLLAKYPLPYNVDAIPDNVLLKPKWELQLKDVQTTGHRTVTFGINSNAVTDDIPSDDLLQIPGALTARIEENQRITPTTHWQDVRHLKLTTSSMEYQPGDVLTIYPKNFPSDVEQLLTTMGWTSVADEPLGFVATSHSASNGHNDEHGSTSYPPPPIDTSATGPQLTLRSLLANHLDILSIPRRSFFATLAHYTTDPFQRDRLLEFTNPEYLDELYDYTTRPRRSVLEVLQEFETVKVPWQRVCSVIPMMRGRQFSIASGGRLKGDDKLARWELLIAIVKYKTVIKQIRQGVCTRYIASLKPGQHISVTYQRGSLGVKQEDIHRPAVMIGPGTGVAPMRGLIYERMQQRSVMPLLTTEASTSPKDILFFGCRSSTADNFFASEWSDPQIATHLDVFTAFSRDQKQKVYVQDLIRQQGAQVFEALHKLNGIVYICGSSGRMPQAVREALIEVVQQGAGCERADAEEYLRRMEKEGRYEQETW